MAAALKVALLRRWYPLMALTRRELRKRYALTVLGSAWTVVAPLAMVAIYVLVFAVILRSGRDFGSARDFALYMLIGLLPYFSIAEGLQRASTSLREDRALLDHESFPAEVVPASRILVAAVGEGVGLLLLAVVAQSFGRPASGWLLTLPLLAILRILIVVGIGWIVSALAIYLTDLTEMLGFGLTAWLLLTPVFYSLNEMPEILRGLTMVNPLYVLIEGYRGVLLTGRAPYPEVVYLLGWALVSFCLGLWFFRKTLERGKEFL